MGFAALGLSAVLAFAGLARANTTAVQLTSNGPQPAVATVNVGDTVTWVGADSQNHSIVSAGFTSPVIHPGESYSQVMQTPGKIPYTQTNFGPSKKGMIIVTVNGPVTLATNRTSIVYGSSVVLSGKSPLPGQPVTLSTQSGGHHGGKAWTDLGAIATAADGSFSTVVQPMTNASYRVTAFAKIASQPVSVQVKPRLTVSAWPVKLPSGRPVRIVARIVPAKASASLVLKQQVGTKKAKTLAQKAVAANGIVTFVWKATPGRSSLHVEMTKVKGGAPYQTTVSRTISIIGTVKPAPPAPPPAPASKTSKTKTTKTKSHKAKTKKNSKKKSHKKSKSSKPSG